MFYFGFCEFDLVDLDLKYLRELFWVVCDILDFGR